MNFQLQLFREAKNVLFWPKMDDFPPFFVNFVQKMFVFDMKLFKKVSFVYKFPVRGPKMSKIVKNHEKKKLTQNVGFLSPYRRFVHKTDFF